MTKTEVVIGLGWVLIAGLLMVDCCMLCDLLCMVMR